MSFMTKKRTILLLFTFAFFVSTYVTVHSYLKNNLPTTFPTISEVKIQKQANSVAGQIQKLQSNLMAATKAKNAIDHQYSNLVDQKNALLQKEGGNNE
jgi:starvation-inducible outer membrane lipoprotein